MKKITLNFYEAFEKFIKGKTVKEFVSYPSFGDMSKPNEERFYGDGIKVTGGYMFLRYGGGAGGEDFNTNFVVSPKGKVIASIGEYTT